MKYVIRSKGWYTDYKWVTSPYTRTLEECNQRVEILRKLQNRVSLLPQMDFEVIQASQPTLKP